MGEEADRETPDPRRGLPAVGRLIERVRAAAAQASPAARTAPAPRPGAPDSPPTPDWAVAMAARRVLAEARDAIETRGALAPDLEALAARATALARDLARPRPRRVVNATGVVLHTNLGRAVLGEGAVRAVAEAAGSYTDVEMDLLAGRRGDRLAGVVAKLVALSGAESAFAVNNNAAAVLLALATLAAGRDVIVSRGELVEIGGSFRVPDIMRRAGARLVEVGTTNRTHADDYRRAIGPQTALLLKVHRSNFEQRGFVADVGLSELAAIGSEHGLPLMEDLGSATLVRTDGAGLPEESFAAESLRRGADLVCFSGDKLLGGPQAGILLGRAGLIARLRRDPLARALRLDKLSLAALDWTLGVLLAGDAGREIPTLRVLRAPAPELERRAGALARRLAEVAGDAARVAVEADRGAVGGGALPEWPVDTRVVSVRRPGGSEALAAALRRAPVPVVARIRDDAVLLDVRTLRDGDDDAVVAALAAALSERAR